jgi:hypothetical protein
MAAVLVVVALSGCGNSGVNCNSASTFTCAAATWPGAMTPAPACTAGDFTSVTACAASPVQTCTYTDSATFASPVTYVLNYYTGADVTAAQAFCTSKSGTWK